MRRAASPVRPDRDRGVKPWTQVTLAEAEAACQAASARLCTRSELQAACMGRQGRPYPYGDMYVAGACNDYRGDRGAQPTGSAPRCSTPEGIADLVGNVAEWCRLDADRTPAVAGGSGKLNALAVSLNLDKCAATEQLPAEMLRADIGFRCCDRCR